MTFSLPTINSSAVNHLLVVVRCFTRLYDRAFCSSSLHSYSIRFREKGSFSPPKNVKKIDKKFLIIVDLFYGRITNIK